MLSTKTILLLLVAIVLVVYITNNNNSSKNSNNNSSNNSANNVAEGFMNDTDSPVNESYVGSGYSGEGFENPREGFKEHGESEEMEEMEEALGGAREGFENQAANNAKLPAECYPKDVLNSSDLLPSSQSLHAQVVPSGAGSLGDKNFLNAGYHIGINTVGQSLRNANRQLRSDPPNPQVKVSPWMQTTIEADVNRKPLEIGS
tara:strand:- start:1968 stop:2576 length:609 start_codon:yes stop_codon:yes gene_type:complete